MSIVDIGKASIKDLIDALKNKEIYFRDVLTNNHEVFSNKEFMLFLVGIDGLKILYASDDLKKDEDVVKVALNNNPFGLSAIDVSLKDREDIVIRAVKKNGLVLQYASSRLRNKKAVVVEAVKSNKDAIKFIGEDLKKDLFFIEQLNVIISIINLVELIEDKKTLLEDLKSLLIRYRLNENLELKEDSYEENRSGKKI